MKKYKINYAYPVNTKTSKNGVKWEYRGKKTEEEMQELKTSFEKTIEERKKKKERGYLVAIGLRITDTETAEIVYEKMI